MSSIDRSRDGYVISGPIICLARRRLSAFQLCSVVGLAIGVTINITLGARLNLPIKLSVAVALLGLLAIPIIAMLVKIVTGEEQLCFYHHVIGVLAATAILLWLLGQPLLPFLDVLILGAGAARAIGYFGCLRAGCCHGRPSRWGVIYDDQYTHILPAALLGVRLFPVQVVEAFWTTGIVAAGCALILRQYEPGIGLAWFIVTYCPARFVFECLRWPPNYHFKSGLSQHQWISVALVLFVVALEGNSVLPFSFWHVVILLALLLATATLVIERRTRSVTRELAHPEHIREVTAAMTSLRKLPGFGIPVDCTSLGLQVSAGKITNNAGEIDHYTLSRREGLTKAAVDLLATAIRQTHAGRVEVLAGNNNVFHLLVHSTRVTQ
jgi:prolipoprotein diacylglyceryltransferase